MSGAAYPQRFHNAPTHGGSAKIGERNAGDQRRIGSARNEAPVTRGVQAALINHQAPVVLR